MDKIAPLNARKPYRVFVKGDKVILTDLKNPYFYTDESVERYNKYFKGKTGVIKHDNYIGELHSFIVELDEPFTDNYNQLTCIVGVTENELDYYEEVE